MWLCGGSVAPPKQEMRLAVVWAVSYSGLDECVFSMCAVFYLWDGLSAYGVASQHLTENWCP